MRLGNPDLTPKQQKAIILMARGLKVTEVATAVGVSEQTIYNWKTKPDFMEDLKDETRFYLEESRVRLGSLVLPAIEVLSSLLASSSQSIQLKAAQEIIKSHGLDTIDDRKHLLLGLGLETQYSKECDAKEERERFLAQVAGI